MCNKKTQRFVLSNLGDALSEPKWFYYMSQKRRTHSKVLLVEVMKDIKLLENILGLCRV